MENEQLIRTRIEMSLHTQHTSWGKKAEFVLLLFINFNLFN